METRPMPLDQIHAGAFAEFRVDSPREVASLLRQLADGNIALNLNASDGHVVSATLWTVDADRGSIGLAVDPTDPALAPLLETEEAVAVGYLDSVKLQFDVQDPVLVRGTNASVLSCRYPREVYRFQRRNAFRVRPLLRNSPVARLRHTQIAEMQLALRVLDISIGGCALFLPEDFPPMQPGVELNQVQIELDADTQFRVDLRLQHVTSLGPDAKGVRLGCEFMRPDPGTLRALQRYIDQTQKRGKLLSLS
ncbi:MAG TPA: flagellar regulator YcgR PilZN domain-containing protein [Burkholderiaceae bacterium]